MLVGVLFDNRYPTSWARQVTHLLLDRSCSSQYFELCHEMLASCLPRARNRKFPKIFMQTCRVAFEIHIKPPTTSRYGSSPLFSPCLGLSYTEVRAGVELDFVTLNFSTSRAIHAVCVTLGVPTDQSLLYPQPTQYDRLPRSFGGKDC